MWLNRGSFLSDQRGGLIVSYRGFTLLEMLVVLVLLGVLLAIAAPSLKGLRQKHQMQSLAEQLQASLLLARSEALRRQQRVTLCVRQPEAASRADCAMAGHWTQGWVVFVDGNDNAQREETESILQVQNALPAFLTLQGNTTVNRYVSYGLEGRSQSTTGAFQAGTLTLCGVGQAHVWRVVINAVGKPRLEKAERLKSANC
jgi:type IV fimbrial biogenesis protein FimT